MIFKNQERGGAIIDTRRGQRSHSDKTLEERQQRQHMEASAFVEATESVGF